MKFKINKKFFIQNRNNLIKKVEPNSLIVINSNDIISQNEDEIIKFKQNNDLFYFTGINQEETILILYQLENTYKEILFLKKNNKIQENWEGKKYNKKKAFSISGIKTIFYLNDFYNIFNNLIYNIEYVYLNTNEHKRAFNNTETKDKKFIKWCKNKYPLHQYKRISPIIHSLRVIKSKYEINIIKKACKITEIGIKKILPKIKHNITEYEIEAELIYEFTKLKSNGFAFNPIIASGKNSCILHYNLNNKQCKNKEILLIDTGVNYLNYNSDITRVFPVNGKFSKRQKEVYKSVLTIMKKAKKLILPEQNINNYNKKIIDIAKKELLKLKLIKNKDSNEYKKYFIHNITHHLGLGVHDVDNKINKFKKGMVLTIEPGIYIKKENLGIRLENNVVIKKNKIEDLSKNIPIEINEIEYLMNQNNK